MEAITGSPLLVAASAAVTKLRARLPEAPSAPSSSSAGGSTAKAAATGAGGSSCGTRPVLTGVDWSSAGLVIWSAYYPDLSFFFHILLPLYSICILFMFLRADYYLV